MKAEVIVDIAHSEEDKIFENRAIDGVFAGSRVKVPFGGRVVDGFVMRLKEGSDFDSSKLKSILSAVDDVPALNAECLKLVEDISARYHCPKALVLRLFLPGEMRKGRVRELYKNVAVFAKEVQVSSRAKAQAAALGYMKEALRADYTDLCAKFGRGAVLMMPASEGTGVIAGGPVRSVMEAVGITDIRTKSHGTNNPINCVKAAIEGLKSLRTAEQVAAIRGITVEEING